ncbi:MAG: hypothetical protein K1Y02_15075 [Candidatus Hydrogenedentes bacterium]|nr:hypothetical protein [Candidatus Hydrogenedentota bacterium]
MDQHTYDEIVKIREQAEKEIVRVRQDAEREIERAWKYYRIYAGGVTALVIVGVFLVGSNFSTIVGNIKVKAETELAEKAKELEAVSKKTTDDLENALNEQVSSFKTRANSDLQAAIEAAFQSENIRTLVEKQAQNSIGQMTADQINSLVHQDYTSLHQRVSAMEGQLKGVRESVDQLRQPVYLFGRSDEASRIQLSPTYSIPGLDQARTPSSLSGSLPVPSIGDDIDTTINLEDLKPTGKLRDLAVGK